MEKRHIFHHMMKIYMIYHNLKSGICFLMLLLLLLSCKRRTEDGFEKIPQGLNQTENLIKGIHPDQDYQYWGYIRQSYMDNNNIKIITGKGDISYLMNNKFNDPKSGFKYKTWEGYFYFAYLEKDSISLVTNQKQLIKFIGKIDELGEALLIASLNGLTVDYSEDIGGSYKKTNNGFEFYLAKFHSCTVRTEPFKISIDTLGNCKIKNLGFFYNVDDSICHD